MFEPTIIVLCLAVLAVAAYCDIKTTEVPDWLSYGAIFAGFGIRLIASFAGFDWSFLTAGILGFAAFAIISYAMYYLGQWGGGDAKLLMGLGALIGLEFKLDGLLISFLVALIFVGCLYGIGWSIALALKNRRAFSKKIKEVMKKQECRTTGIIAASGVLALIIVAIFTKSPFGVLLLFAAASLVILFLAALLVRTTELCCMFKYVRPSKLTEGDWIPKNVVVRGKIVCPKTNLGIDRKTINQLISLEKQNKLKKVMIKTGMPFVPGILLAFITALIFGNILLYFIK